MSAEQSAVDELRAAAEEAAMGYGYADIRNRLDAERTAHRATEAKLREALAELDAAYRHITLVESALAATKAKLEAARAEGAEGMRRQIGAIGSGYASDTVDSFLEQIAALSIPATENQPMPVATSDETAWLIEIDHPPPLYYGNTHEGLALTSIHSAAVRFARAEDAQAVIDDIGWTDAKPVEHMWCAALTTQEKTDGR